MLVESRFAPDPIRTRGLDTAGLRKEFLIENMFTAGEIALTYSHVERLVVGGAVPTGTALKLEPAKPTGTKFFLERRELGIMNIGAPGKVTVDGTSYELGNRDGLYIGMGAVDVSFESLDAANPARFYLMSTPAHRACPTKLLKVASAKRLDLGSLETSNQRSIFQMLVPAVCDSCQLVFGMTELAPGSVWNTMPAHVHDRRSEIYLYFDIAKGQKVMHFMGEPSETRHLVVGEGEAVISPPWSIHSGCGTGNYTFIWAMGGDNVDYTDMDPVTMEMLK